MDGRTIIIVGTAIGVTIGSLINAFLPMLLGI
jgi:hypothetical protein